MAVPPTAREEVRATSLVPPSLLAWIWFCTVRHLGSVNSQCPVLGRIPRVPPLLTPRSVQSCWSARYGADGGGPQCGGAPDVHESAGNLLHSPSGAGRRAHSVQLVSSDVPPRHANQAWAYSQCGRSTSSPDGCLQHQSIFRSPVPWPHRSRQ
ncbi:hypothetical protein NDU88_001451 [Pleurodeles waltl]|uniref:Secreted protein n=1 Tax=Pleurodeles waltl TaxID=8319 RepID=A0AAV7U783_PLEWA|nr:hypothetical protein NDU88_001451 [Pleurodeles waltl]